MNIEQKLALSARLGTITFIQEGMFFKMLSAISFFFTALLPTRIQGIGKAN